MHQYHQLSQGAHLMCGGRIVLHIQIYCSGAFNIRDISMEFNISLLILYNHMSYRFINFFFNSLCITQYLKRNRMLQSAQKKTTCRGSSRSNKHRKCFIAWKYVLSLQIRRVTIVVRFWCLVLIILNPETLSQISYQTYLTSTPKQITLHHCHIFGRTICTRVFQ